MTAHLRRREDGAVELRVNGVFVMDDLETSSERLLADLALRAGARDVLVGGLGLGFTARTLLEGGARRVLVAELEPEVVQWFTDGRIAPGLVSDPRCEVVLGDVVDVVAAQPRGSWDAVLLDVDNGPDFLVHEANAAIYTPTFLQQCREALRPGGLVALWSMNRSDALVGALAAHFDNVGEVAIEVNLQGRPETYWVQHGTASPLANTPRT